MFVSTGTFISALQHGYRAVSRGAFPCTWQIELGSNSPTAVAKRRGSKLELRSLAHGNHLVQGSTNHRYQLLHVTLFYIERRHTRRRGNFRKTNAMRIDQNKVWRKCQR